MSTAAPPAPVSPMYDNDSFVSAADMSTSKVGGIAPERPEGSPSEAPRFMTSTWHQDVANRSLKRPLSWLAYRLMYKGPQTPRSGKMPVHSVWTQREPCFRRSFMKGKFLMHFPLNRCFRVPPCNRADGGAVHIHEVFSLYLAHLAGLCGLFDLFHLVCFVSIHRSNVTVYLFIFLLPSHDSSMMLRHMNALGMYNHIYS